MIHVRIDPPEAGKLWLDGHTYDPRIPYKPGETVQIKVLPVGDYQFAGWVGDVPAGCEADVPLCATVTERTRELVAQFVRGVRHAAELSVDSSFENGNGTPRYIYQNSRMVVVEPDQIAGADNIWWHFRIDGITPGEFLQVWPLHSPLGDEQNIAWAGDCHPVYSYDGITWHRFVGRRVPYVQRFTAPSVTIARNTPYTHSRTLDLVREVASAHAVPTDLATSEGGRRVVMIRFSDPAVPDVGKRVIWIMARQHAFESHGSWYAEGIVRWLAGDHPLAADLRRRAICFITPIMDVDNVAVGGSGKEQIGPDGRRADFNRCWDEHSPWAAIRAVKALLTDLGAEHEIAVFIDLHNPWYPRPGYWGIDDEFADEVLPFAELWTRCLEETGTGARLKHDLRVRGCVVGVERAIHANREPTRDTLTALAWAREALAQDPESKLYFLSEIPHWKNGYGDFVGIPELLAYGEAMGRALAVWFDR